MKPPRKRSATPPPVLATSGGGDQAGAAKSVRVTPSAPTAGDIQRSQPPGANGPGARP